jgi:hypothetical protein
MPLPIQIVLAVVFALAFASFSNVIVDRLPVALDEPNEFGELHGTRPWAEVVGGTSRCSTCASPVRAVDNIPVISYLLLRGKCRSCGERIPIFHLVVEAVVPVVVGLVVSRLGIGVASAHILWLVLAGVALATIDMRTMIVPTILVWPSAGVSALVIGTTALIEGSSRIVLGALLGVVGIARHPGYVVAGAPRRYGFRRRAACRDAGSTPRRSRNDVRDTVAGGGIVRGVVADARSAARNHRWRYLQGRFRSELAVRSSDGGVGDHLLHVGELNPVALLLGWILSHCRAWGATLVQLCSMLDGSLRLEPMGVVDLARPHVDHDQREDSLACKLVSMAARKS